MEDSNLKYVPINLILFLKEKNHQYDIYLKINNNYIKIGQKESLEPTDLKKLIDKGATTIYLTQEGYQQYINSKLAIIKEINKPENHNVVQLIDELSENAQLMTSLFKETGCDAAKIEVAHAISQEVIKIIENEKDFKDLFESFKNKSKHDFFRKTFTCIISAYMLRIKEIIDPKMIQSYCCAVLLSDIFLTEQEIVNSYTTYDKIENNKKILHHGEKLLAGLPHDSLLGSSIFTNLIKFHHELPDGSGYPNRMKYTRFDLFLCTYYIADLYYIKMKENNFRLDNQLEIIESINRICSKYRTKFFIKALANFNRAFNYDSGVIDE